MTTEFDIIVAGGGIAGLTAGLHAARLGASCLVLTGDVPGGHLLSIGRVDGYPGFPEGIAGYALCPDIQLEAAEAGAEFAATSLTGLARDGERLTVRTGEGERRAGAVVLATGTSFKTLDVPGAARLHGRGISHCASCDGPMLRDKTVAVIGGGDSAMQEALTLAEFAARVVLVHRGNALGGQAAYRERIAAQSKIEVRPNETLREVHGDDGVSAITLDGGDLEVAALFIYIGLVANTACLDGLIPLDAAGRVPTGASLASALEGVFAAGTIRSGAAGRAAASAGDGANAAIAAQRYLSGLAWEDMT